MTPIDSASRCWNPRILGVAIVALIAGPQIALADQALMKTHCSKCHSGKNAEGDFALTSLGEQPDAKSIDRWLTSLDYVEAGEMPPAEKSRLSPIGRQKIVNFLKQRIRRYDQQAGRSKRIETRRLNNRELVNSVADVLLIENVGTHEPTANLLGDALHDGFDTNGDALGLSEYHLDQYINAFRKILDSTILTGPRPETRRVKVTANDLRVTDLSHRKRDEKANRTSNSIEILDIRKHAYFANFQTVPVSGRYKIKIHATGIDRGIYDSEETGHYEDDPIRIRVHLGDQTRDFDLPDEDVAALEIDEWLAEGTRIEISYLTDALRMKGNGNFKFQYRIAHDYLKDHDPKLYQRVVREEVPKARSRSDSPSHWVHWTKYWQGPRPRLFGADIEGPIYETWPPKRQAALLGSKPTAENALAILRPIAGRAWRRDIVDGELDSIVRMVRMRKASVGDVEALKEGIVAVLASPSFLMINPIEVNSADRFATKLSYFLRSTIPDEITRRAAREGKLQSFDSVRAEIQRQFDEGHASEFLREFPYAWLQLDRINFMAPDPDRYPIYDKKRVSIDMINEVLHFFGHAVDQNVPVHELLTADYSFVNADLAKVYDIEGVPRDSKLRKYEFKDGRRGGLLGMGAFLTLTADSLATSPIHRAVYVMENFLGIHPSPPPADVNIEEPDVRSAKTIREVLQAHQSDRTCASCHQAIDPFGYAFENFDPVGAWRDEYTAHLEDPSAQTRRRQSSKAPKIPVDASASFMSGAEYTDISGFRELMKSKANRGRFVRCFITKLLVYANGTPPEDFSEIEKIVSRSAENDYRIIDTIAAVVDSPLFREE